MEFPLKISSNLTKFDIASKTVRIGTCDIQCVKSGNIATISCLSGTVDIIGDKVLFTIPDGYQPYIGVDFSFRNPINGGAAIGKNGAFVPFITLSSAPLRFSISYVCH